MDKSHRMKLLHRAQESVKAYQIEEEQATKQLMLSGWKIITLGLVQNLQNSEKQVQPAGIDFTLKRLATLESAGIIDFDNTKRVLPRYQLIKFENNGTVGLQQGAYLVEFNETVSLPNNITGIMRTRSSVFRSGATLTAGVIDPGYSGAIGALLQVWNKKGISLSRNARLVQWVFAEVCDPPGEGYEGTYKDAKTIF
jgi:dUTP pyrophosphatase